MAALKADYPWIQTPLIVGAPMRLIALAPLATEISKAGGLGFIGTGECTHILEAELANASALLRSAGLPSRPGVLPVGVGFLNWGAQLPAALECLARYRPAAAWFFAPRSLAALVEWTAQTREATRGETKIWIQVGHVDEAVAVVRACRPDVLVVQGTDAGGHGKDVGAGLAALFPEVADAVGKLGGPLPALVATGGIAEGRGVAAALALGADGVVMGTRYLAAHDSSIAQGYRDEVVRAADGGKTTVRSSVYDQLRGTTDWPSGYGARGVINRSYEDAVKGLPLEQNKKLYEQAAKLGDAGWGVDARMTTYAGSAVGLVTEAQSARAITEQVREEARVVVRRLESRL